ncbi:unnamed protein product, partial [Caretta caretta]
LSEKYCSIFTIYLGSEQVVVLYGHEILKEALISLREEFMEEEVCHYLKNMPKKQ